MGKSLKDQNALRLTSVVIGNLAIFFAIFGNGTYSLNDLSSFSTKIGAWLPGVITIPLVVILNGLIGPEMKARLVFWRWANPLPGCRAFSEYAHLDPRIDMVALKQKIKNIPTDEREQNALWFRIYKSVSYDISVSDSHRYFLFSRDYTALSFLFLVFGTAFLTVIQNDKIKIAAYTAFLIVQYLVVRNVAVKAGHGFVTTVLAVKAAEE